MLHLRRYCDPEQISAVGKRRSCPGDKHHMSFPAWLMGLQNWISCGATGGYIVTGASIPRRARPLAIVIRVAATRARRAVRVGSADCKTGQAW